MTLVIVISSDITNFICLFYFQNQGEGAFSWLLSSPSSITAVSSVSVQFGDWDESPGDSIILMLEVQINVYHFTPDHNFPKEQPVLLNHCIPWQLPPHWVTVDQSLPEKTYNLYSQVSLSRNSDSQSQAMSTISTLPQWERLFGEVNENRLFRSFMVNWENRAKYFTK